MTDKGGDKYRIIVDDVVAPAAWDTMFALWKSGVLKSQWALQHPDLFDDRDAACRQPNKYFAEWYAAVLLKQRFGLLSLVSKFGYHGCRSHLRKQAVLERCLTPDQHQYVIRDPISLFGHATGWPDLFVYQPDYSTCLFCEVKGPNDQLRPRQLDVFDALHDATGLEVVLFQFHFDHANH